MADRVKQALFDVLGDVQEIRVLDLYAGSGALGIETLSRGAAHATFVESSAAALAALRSNLGELGLTDRSTVLGLRVERARRSLGAGAPYHLVFCAPPWTEVNAALQVVGRILPEHLASDALLVVDHRAKAPPGSPRDFDVVDRRAWGDSGVTLFRYAGERARSA